MSIPITSPDKPYPLGFTGYEMDRDPLKSTSGNACMTAPTFSEVTSPNKSSPPSKRTHSEANGEGSASKKRRTSQNPADNVKNVTTKKRTHITDGIPDLSDIHIDGEDTDTVPIRDSCGEMRKKISSYLRRKGVKQTELLRAFKDQYHTDKQPLRMDSGRLNKFRAAQGPDGGNTNTIYYAAYVFFEKLRIKEGKPKSQHRLDMEKAWLEGADTKRLARNKG